MYSSPAVANGIVYAGSGDSYLYALDAVTGALKWRYLTGSAVFSSPNVVNGIVYFGSYDDKVYALNATTGALVWSFTTGGAVFASPMVANGVVYVGSYDGSLYALNAATGAKYWSYAMGGSLSGSAVFAGGYICAGSSNGNMYGLYAATGTLAWTFSANGGSAISSSPAAVGGALFFGDSAGRVYSLSTDGAVRWTTALTGVAGVGLTTVESPVCVANGVVYATNKFYTYALDQRTGALLTALQAGSTYGGPAVVNGALFAGDDNHGGLARFTPNALLSNYVAPRPDPMQLRPHPLR
jgi:outer membrane protein assembly factor BamB